MARARASLSLASWLVVEIRRLLLALVVHLGAEHVETRAGAGLVRVGGLVEGELGAGQLGIHGLDPGFIGDAEQIRVADGEDDQVASVLRGELGRLEVVLGGHVGLKGVQVDQVLRQVGAEILYLKGSDDRIDSGELKSVGGEVDLLHGDRRAAGHGGQQRLQALEALAAGLALARALEDQAQGCSAGRAGSRRRCSAEGRRLSPCRAPGFRGSWGRCHSATCWSSG